MYALQVLCRFTTKNPPRGCALARLVGVASDRARRDESASGLFIFSFTTRCRFWRSYEEGKFLFEKVLVRVFDCGNLPGGTD